MKIKAKEDIDFQMEKLLEKIQSRTLALKKILESVEAQTEENLRKKAEEKIRKNQ